MERYIGKDNAEIKNELLKQVGLQVEQGFGSIRYNLHFDMVKKHNLCVVS
jgi:hypothetical protein